MFKSWPAGHASGLRRARCCFLPSDAPVVARGRSRNRGRSVCNASGQTRLRGVSIRVAGRSYASVSSPPAMVGKRCARLDPPDYVGRLVDALPSRCPRSASPRIEDAAESPLRGRRDLFARQSAPSETPHNRPLHCRRLVGRVSSRRLFASPLVWRGLEACFARSWELSGVRALGPGTHRALFFISHRRAAPPAFAMSRYAVGVALRACVWLLATRRYHSG